MGRQLWSSRGQALKDSARRMHCFVLPNATAYLVALGVIELQQLDCSECIFVSTRSFEVPGVGLAKTKLPFAWADFPYSLDFYAARKARIDFDAWVQRNLPSEYTVYLPHYRMPHYQLLATHAHCVEVNFMEEGLSAYFTNAERQYRSNQPSRLRDNVVSLIGYHGRVSRRSGYVSNDYRSCYALLPGAFPGQLNVRTVPFLPPEPLGLGDREVLILALRKEFSFDRGWGLEGVLSMLQGIVRWCKSNQFLGILLKRHPGELTSEPISVLASRYLIASGINVEFLDDDASLESSLLCARCTVVTMGSSIDYYSRLLNGTVLPGVAFQEISMGNETRYLDENPECVRAYLRELIAQTRLLISQ